MPEIKKFTIETIIRPNLGLNLDTLEYLKIDVEKQSRLFRIVWKLIQTTRQKQSHLNTYLQNTYHIDKRTANTLIQSAKGRLKALKALKDVERTDLQNKINSLESQIATLEVIVQKQKETAKNNELTESQLEKYRHNKHSLWQKIQKLNRLKQRLTKLNKILESPISPIIPICWGSKRGFKAQYNLIENGFKTHNNSINI